MPLTKDQILSLLYGDKLGELKEKTKFMRIEEMRTQQKSGMNENPYAEFD